MYPDSIMQINLSVLYTLNYSTGDIVLLW